MDNKKFAKPTLDEIKAYIEEKSLEVDAEQFLDHYDANGWKAGRTPMKDWKATLRNWHRINNSSILAKKSDTLNKLDEELLCLVLELVKKMPKKGYHKLKRMTAQFLLCMIDDELEPASFHHLLGRKGITPEITMPGRGFVKMPTAAGFLDVSPDRLDEMETEGLLHSYFIDGQQMYATIELCAVRNR